jgi:serine protease Do
MSSRIVIRYITGAKANQVDQIDLEGLVELTIGRDPSCNVAFESPRDDYVSRRHAAIRIENGDHFKLIDLDSRNGTLLNGNVVKGEVELSPADIIELGAEGPKFSFDVQPRPAHFMTRTRLLPKGVGATRVVMPSDTNASKPAAAAPAPVAVAPVSTPAPVVTPAEPVQRPIGRNTVIGMMAAQQSRTNRNWMYMLAGALLIIAAGGGGLYYHNKSEAEYAAAELDKQAEELKAQKAAAAAEAAKQTAALKAQQEAAEKGAQKAKEDAQLALRNAVGVSPREIAKKYGNAVVMVELQWRLFDRSSGKQLYHRAITVKGRRVPAYVHVGNNKFVRWLTTEDENQTNFAMFGAGKGTGFVIDSQGYILTNKHVAAGWSVSYQTDREFDVGLAFDFEDQGRKSPYVFDPSTHPELMSWLPERGPLFRPEAPVLIGIREFEGRNDRLDVRFPGSPLQLAARLMRISVEADVAEIKVDAQQPFATVELSDGRVAPVGEQVTVLGYPYFSKNSQAVIRSTELGDKSQHVEVVPEPTVTTGNIALITTGVRSAGGSTTIGPGDTYQLTVPSSSGNSGGPVFDHTGKVIGIFTYGTARETTTYAIPIKFGLELLKVQRSASEK